jgi:hypothetical protein
MKHSAQAQWPGDLKSRTGSIPKATGTLLDNAYPIHRRCCFVSACIALFSGSALCQQALGQQAQFQGSVPMGVASPTPVALTLRDAIDRGLKTNLGLLLSGQVSESARGERLRSLSALLPQVTGAVSENVEQINLLTKGINFHVGSFSSPAIVGPFDYTDARAYASFSVFDYSLRKTIVVPKRASAPLSYRSKTLAIWSYSP